MAPEGVERTRRLLLETVGASADLTLVSVARGPADELAAAGARALLARRSHRELPLAQLPAARGELLLFAGWCGDAGDAVLAHALGVGLLRFARVVVLPASFSAHDDALLRALPGSGAIVFAGDPVSLATISSRCDARFAHDCAFFHDFSAHARDGSGVLDVFVAHPRTPADGRREHAGAGGAAAARELGAWLDTIAGHEAVRTDCARVMIAAALLGKRVEYASDGDGRLEWVAEHALAGFPVSRAEADPGVAGGRPMPAPLRGGARDTLLVLESAARATPPADVRANGRVTAALLTRDRPGLARRALDSLARATAPPHVLVIDQNSTPANARSLAAECANRADVELHRSEENLGCAGGRLLASGLARSELVLFLDDDAELLPGALEHLVAQLDAHPDAGAVAATIVTPDGVIAHSGGSCEIDTEIATFGLIGSGLRFAPGVLPPSGCADWAPGTALLVRRELLDEFPLDDGMAAYYEDNEWCHRVSRVRPGIFRRCAEALVLHQLTPKRTDGPSFAARALAVDLLASTARFYERHGLLMGPWLFDLVPGLVASDGTRDLSSARLLMELLRARGTDWFLAAWMNGELTGLIDSQRRAVELEATQRTLAKTRDQLDLTWRVLTGARTELEDAHTELRRLAGEISSRDETITWLHHRHETLMQIEQGGWWRLRERLLPLLRIAERVRART